MYCADKEIVAALNTVLATSYEQFIDSTAALPFITYIPIDNKVNISADTLGYSYISYRVKIWAHSLAELAEYMTQIDSKLREIGFTRVSMHDVTFGVNVCRVLTYSGQTLENFN